MKNYGNDLEAKAKSLPALVGKLINYQTPDQRFTFDCFKVKSIEKGIIKLICENAEFLEDDVSEFERQFSFTVEDFLKGKWATIQEDDSNEKSYGHVAFYGDYEYFQLSGNIIRAPRSNPIFPDGKRCGRFYTKAGNWNEAETELKDENSFNDRRNEMLGKN